MRGPSQANRQQSGAVLVGGYLAGTSGVRRSGTGTCLALAETGAVGVRGAGGQSDLALGVSVATAHANRFLARSVQSLGAECVCITAKEIVAISRGVWEALLGGTITAEDAMLAAGSAGDPWITPLPGTYPAGSAGALVSGLDTKVDDTQALVLAK